MSGSASTFLLLFVIEGFVMSHLYLIGEADDIDSPIFLVLKTFYSAFSVRGQRIF